VRRRIASTFFGWCATPGELASSSMVLFIIFALALHSLSMRIIFLYDIVDHSLSFCGTKSSHVLLCFVNMFLRVSTRSIVGLFCCTWNRASCLRFVSCVLTTTLRSCFDVFVPCLVFCLPGIKPLPGCFLVL
jgi:uncharacterized membrane protein YjgN (DUF898 family)